MRAHHVFSQLDVAVDDELLEAVLFAQLGQRALLELLPDTGHREERRRMTVAEVLGDRRETAGEPGIATDGDREEVADHPLGDVAQRQEGQEPFSLADVHHGRGAAERPHDVGMADHHPFGRPGRAARVHERRQLVGRDRVRPGVEHTGLSLQPSGADGAQLFEAADERIVETLVVVEDHDVVELG